jgi:pimeloyl-ACP methyl ester carboxylesterase
VISLLKKAALGIVAILLVGPFLVPVSSSGTLTKEAAAATVWGNESEWVELAGHEVHYVTAGDKASDRLIILMHGFGASALSYRDVMEPLSKLGYVIAYDRAAFGFTERPTEWQVNPYGIEGQLQVIDDLISKFGQNKEVFLLGHSAGGSIAASYAVDNQDRLDGLILFAPAVLTSGGSPSWLNWVYSVPQLDHLGPLLVSTIATNGLDLLYTSYFDESKVTDEILAGYTSPLKIEGWEQAFWEFNRAPRDSDISKRLSEITSPTLVITGDTDKVVTAADSINVSQIIKNSELVIIKNAGHLPNEESPVEFAEAVSSFIQKLEVSSARK